ncbi:LCP family protein [Ilumatobacter sp.]|uniref:LCP family protein n=1 Tax=Ilumatobacter sp. TaxID=1967498 RepID=UPI003AF7BE61
MSITSESRALSGLDGLEQRLRGPDLQEGSPGAQMAASIVVPGLPAFRRHPLLALLLLIVGVIVPVLGTLWAYANRGDLIGLALDPRFLTGVTLVGLAAIVARLAALGEIAHAFRRRPGIGAKTTMATVVVIALGLPVLWVSMQANEARGAVANVFASSDGEALFTPPADGTEPVDPDAVTNILLLGGDEGPGRWGLRTDTMILVSVHDASGRTSLVSIPRNLTRLDFPPGTPMHDRFPDGFDDLANAVFPYVSTREELVTHYGRDGLQAEAVALSEAIGYSLDVQIDDYALVNMQGFTEVIDAVGGFTIELGERVPLPPSLPGERPLPETIGPGLVEMDGALAIAYARSRSADSDYERMGRQRQLLAALGSQVSPSDAIRGFTTVTGVLDDAMRTSLSAGEFSDLLDRLGDNNAIHESIGLTPPLITPGSPDYALIRRVVDAVEQAVVSGAASGYAG